MKYAILDIDILKEIDPNWEHRRRSNDGKKAIIHKEQLDELRSQVSTMMLDEGIEQPYPFPLVTADEINELEDFRPLDECP